MNAYLTLRKQVAAELLERLQAADPVSFERVVLDVLVAMGYGGSREEVAEMMTKRSGDNGIDGVIKQDRSDGPRVRTGETLDLARRCRKAKCGSSPAAWREPGEQGRLHHDLHVHGSRPALG